MSTPQTLAMSSSDDDDEDDEGYNAFLASSPSESRQPSKSGKTSTKMMTIQRDRQATLLNRDAMEMLRKTRLALATSIDETQGSLQFIVPISKILLLPPSTDGDSLTAAIRTTFYRRFECLQPNRREDDAPYVEAVRQGISVCFEKALPKGYKMGGWRCHALVEEKECLHPNKSNAKCCSKCLTPKPNLKPAFAYLRLLLPGMRQQRREYLRVIQECDAELRRCEVAEQEANTKIADYNARIEQGLIQIEDEHVELAMDVDLIQKGVWQRGNARSLLPMLFDRMNDLHTRLKRARAEVAIMIQCTFELAVVHAQKIVRRFLVRCSLGLIRKAKNDYVRFSAAVQIQRFARRKQAKNMLLRLRQHRDCLMATKIQSIARMRKAVLERRRLWEIYFLQLQDQKATVIQSAARAYAAKFECRRLAELKRLCQQERERDRIASMERNAATLIQSIYRRHLGQIKCRNRRIEMNLHGRILIYLERYAIDGCLWTFVKSINEDYRRFERTITSVIQREEKMAKTFVEKVVKARDEDHSSAWKNYHSLKENTARFVTPTSAIADARTIHSKSAQAQGDGSQKRDSTVHIHIYENALAGMKRAPTKRKERRSSQSQVASSNKRDDLYRREAKRLSLRERTNARLRGQYVRFDIPNGLDDTVARFIKAVAMRYNCGSSEESCVEQNLLSSSSVSPVDKKRLEYADELIHALHGKGFVFIRQLLPKEHMRSVLRSSMAEKDFILLSHALVTVLQRMDRGNHLERSYLMMKCNSLLDTQSRSRAAVITGSTGGTKTNETADIVHFLGECGSAGCGEEFDDDDIPEGLFEARNPPNRSVPPLPRNDLLQTNKNIRKSKSSWAVKFTQKIIHDEETKSQAYQNYRRGQLLANSNDVTCGV